MKIHFPKIKYIIGSSVLSGGLLAVASTSASNINQLQHDTFEIDSVPPNGTTKEKFLVFAPSPNVKVCGRNKKAKIVVDLKTNILYTYNEFGEAQCAYSIASGRTSTPTTPGVRIISHVERYPYQSAPIKTKRRKNPKAYGPRAIILDILNTKTGKRSSIGEFIHGNNNPNSIGKYVSHGCMRMDNEVIKQLSKKVKRGDIVLILAK